MDRGIVSLLALAGALLLAAPVQAQGGTMPPPSMPLPAMPLPTVPASPEEPPLVLPQVQAASAMLVDATTGTVLYHKNARTRRPIASTTKIMTATLMIESGRLDEVVTFSEKARHTPYANVNAKPGEKFTMRDLLYAVMMRSSNDACVAVAEHLDGSVAAFAKRMTEKARELGAADTNFVTVNGLFHKDHYSTAYDLAIMTRYAMRYPEFNDAAGTKTRPFNRVLNPKDALLVNHNKFLGKYPGADGVKTGYVRQSGRCLVASATQNEEGNPWRLVAVMLNSGDTYGDSIKLMEWGKQNFQPVFFAKRGEQLALASVEGGMHRFVPLVAAGDLVAITRRQVGKNTEREIRAESRLAAPVEQNQPGGKLVGLVNGQAVAEVDLVAAQPVGQVWTAGVAPFTAWSVLLAVLVMGPRYARSYAARTFTKGPRRRGRRLATGGGEPDLERESLC